MPLERSQQPTTNIMSIDAITTSCCCSNQLHSKSTVIPRQSLSDTTLCIQEEHQLSPMKSSSRHEPHEYYKSEEGATSYWVKSSNQEFGFIPSQSPKHKCLTSNETIITSSPSFSTSSSEHESNYNYDSSVSTFYHSRQRTSSSVVSRNSFSFHSENDIFNKHRMPSFEYNDSYYISNYKNNTLSGENDVIANRRARNKLASAKYRVKKQALTHAMQDRIMQLAKQVMNLRDELTQSKNNENELLGKYERLVKYIQNDKSAQ